MALYCYLFFVWWCMTAFISGTAVNLVQFTVLPLFWLHRRTYHYLINKLSYLIYAHFTFIAEWWGNFQVHIYTPTPEVVQMGEENCLVVFNHSALDWLGGWLFTERVNCIAHTRVLMKYIVKFVPVIGFNLWFCEYGFLSRNWSKDKMSLQQFIDGCKEATSPFIISLCPEGTRLSKEKLEASQEYARQNNLPILKHHLTPRTKGFAAISHSLKDHVHAIYDCEFGFPDPDNATISTLVQRGTVVGHLYTRRIPITEFDCSNEQQASDFLIKLFQEKDKCLEYFEQNERFDAPVIHVERQYKNLMTFIVSSLFSFCVIAYVVTTCVRAYSFETLIILSFTTMSILILTVFVCAWLASPSKASSFGLKKKEN